MPELCERFAGVCGWLLKPCSCTLGSHNYVFHGTAFLLSCPFENSVWNPFSPVSRSSACSGHCCCGIRLSAHHFWNLQFPHLQVSLIALPVCAALTSKSTSAEENFFYCSQTERKERDMFETGLMVHAAIGAGVVLTWLFPWQQLSRWSALKQLGSVFKLPGGLMYWSQTPYCYFPLVIISVFIRFVVKAKCQTF